MYGSPFLHPIFPLRSSLKVGFSILCSLWQSPLALTLRANRSSTGPGERKLKIERVIRSQLNNVGLNEPSDKNKYRP